MLILATCRDPFKWAFQRSYLSHHELLTSTSGFRSITFWCTILSKTQYELSFKFFWSICYVHSPKGKGNKLDPKTNVVFLLDMTHKKERESSDEKFLFLKMWCLIKFHHIKWMQIQWKMLDLSSFFIEMHWKKKELVLTLEKILSQTKTQRQLHVCLPDQEHDPIFYLTIKYK